MSEGFAGRKNDSFAGKRSGWVCGVGMLFGLASFCLLFCELKTPQRVRGGQVAVEKGSLRLGCLRVSPAEKMIVLRGSVLAGCVGWACFSGLQASASCSAS